MNVESWKRCEKVTLKLMQELSELKELLAVADLCGAHVKFSKTCSNVRLAEIIEISACVHILIFIQRSDGLGH